MSISRLPLGYCTNVHAGKSADDVIAGLDHYTVQVKEQISGPLAAGLWLAEPVIREILQTKEGARSFRALLQERDLTCHTLNAFPYGDFHSERVKENVYLPDWADSRRLDYTVGCATVLAELLPAGVDGSMSTVPLGFKEFEHPADFHAAAIAQLIELSDFLSQLHERTGRRIRLAIEPEPFCLLETTAETLVFFDQLFSRANDLGKLATVREYIGVCYDVCHQAVEFEDVSQSIQQLADAGVRINKVHITCALKAERPGENADVREALAHYVEPRYLHQTMVRANDGSILRCVDLTGDLALRPPPGFLDAEEWRVHFHVPVNAESLGPLKTTRAELKQALQAVARLDYAPHLEVETYTWGVLPEGEKTDLVAGLTAELQATISLLDEIDRSA